MRWEVTGGDNPLAGVSLWGSGHLAFGDLDGDGDQASPTSAALPTNLPLPLPPALPPQDFIALQNTFQCVAGSTNTSVCPEEYAGELQKALHLREVKGAHCTFRVETLVPPCLSAQAGDQGEGRGATPCLVGDPRGGRSGVQPPPRVRTSPAPSSRHQFHVL
jgi:hypothetical protein